LQAQAQSELAFVTLDVVHANIMFSTADNTAAPYYNKHKRDYMSEYLEGRNDYHKGEFAGAVFHLAEADKIIRRDADWNEPKAQAPIASEVADARQPLENQFAANTSGPSRLASIK